MSEQIDKKKIKSLMHSLGLKYNLQDEVIKKIVDSPYLFTAKTFKQLDFPLDMTEKEFDKLKTVFMYRCFGKLIVDYKLINARNNRIKTFKK